MSFLEVMPPLWLAHRLVLSLGNRNSRRHGENLPTSSMTLETASTLSRPAISHCRIEYSVCLRRVFVEEVFES